MQYLIVLALAAVAHAAPQPAILDPRPYVSSVITRGAYIEDPALAYAPARTILADAPAILTGNAPAIVAAHNPSILAAQAYADHYRYDTGLAIPSVTPEGYLADTPAVAFAKYAHISEHALHAARFNPYSYYL